MKAALRPADEVFMEHCRTFGLPPFVREYQFAKISDDRKWRFDFAFIGRSPTRWRVAVEIEGVVMRQIAGEWRVGGRHATPSGFREDCIKYNTAARLGWYVLRFTPDLVRNKLAIAMVMQTLAANGWVKRV